MKVKTISKIKFDDRAIDKIVVDDLDFSFVDKNGNNKFRRQIIIPFDVPKRSFLKGLKLCIQRDTGYCSGSRASLMSIQLVREFLVLGA